MGAHHHHHGHTHGHGHGHQPASYGRAFAIGVVLNTLFVVVEAGFGFWSGSMALVADAGYGSFGLALRCVLELIARGVLDDGADAGYRALAAARLPG